MYTKIETVDSNTATEDSKTATDGFETTVDFDGPNSDHKKFVGPLFGIHSALSRNKQPIKKYQKNDTTTMPTWRRSSIRYSISSVNNFLLSVPNLLYLLLRMMTPVLFMTIKTSIQPTVITKYYPLYQRTIQAPTRTHTLLLAEVKLVFGRPNMVCSPFHGGINHLSPSIGQSLVKDYACQSRHLH